MPPVLAGALKRCHAANSPASTAGLGEEAPSKAKEGLEKASPQLGDGASGQAGSFEEDLGGQGKGKGKKSTAKPPPPPPPKQTATPSPSPQPTKTVSQEIRTPPSSSMIPEKATSYKLPNWSLSSYFTCKRGGPNKRCKVVYPHGGKPSLKDYSRRRYMSMVASANDGTFAFGKARGCTNTISSMTVFQAFVITCIF